MSNEGDLGADLLRRYLLGDRMGDAEQSRVERAYFEGDDHLDRLLEIEDDLIDAYIRGGLSPRECAQFERHFLAAKRRRDRYEATRAIAASFFRDDARPRRFFLTGLRDFFVAQSPAARTAMAALGAAAVVAFALLSVGYVRLRREDLNTRALLAQARLPPAFAVMAFTLRPGLLRAGAAAGNQIHFESSAEWLVLRLETPALREYPGFFAALSTAPGEEILRQDRISPGGATIDLKLPAGVLTAGQDYVISLAGLDSGGRRVELQSYAFHVTK